MQWTNVMFLAPAAALAAILGCGGGETAATTASASGSGGSGTTSGSGGATTSASGTGGAATTSTGQGGSSGSSTASSSSASSSAASSSGTGTSACNWAAVDPCGPGMYCDAPTCQQGTCAPLGGVETSDKAPVCGCDGVTYWNASVAKKQGQSVATNAACAPGKTCGGFGGVKCPKAASCAYQGSDSSSCNIADGSGTCWAMPDVCPPVLTGAQGHACGGSCTDECNLIKKGTSYYADSTCP